MLESYGGGRVASGRVMTRQGGIRRRAVCVAVAGILAVGAPIALGSSSAYGSGSPAPANAVIVWDSNAQTAIWDIAGQQPQVQARSFAMVHGAIYDAVNAIAGTPYQRYLIAPSADGTESTNAAVATAAFRVLNALFPTQQVRLQTQYDESLAAIPDGT